MKIATWNVNSVKARIEHIVEWCSKNQPDVVCLQETKCIDENFPSRRLAAIGFPHTRLHGEKSYNGVAILSKYPIHNVQKNVPDDDAASQRRLIAATVNNIRVVNVYAPNGKAPGTDAFRFKLDWLGRLRKYFDQNSDPHENVLLCGDLNVAPHEWDVWKPSLWTDKVHFTKPERDALLNVKKWGFVDVFRQVNGDVRESSWWDHFHHSFEKDRGLRIDHIWASPPLADLCIDCWIDKDPRAWDRPSDHAPVIAEFRMT